MAGSVTVQRAALALVALSVVHLIVLGIDAASYVSGWIGLELWTAEHWWPLREQSRALVESGAAFWSTLGSFAVPTIVLCLLVRHLARSGIPVPAFVGWSMAGWMLVGTIVLEPSGLPVGLGIAIWLWTGLRRGTAD